MPAPFRPISASRSRGGSANDTSAKTMFAPKLWVRPDACRVGTPVACRFGARARPPVAAPRSRRSALSLLIFAPVVRGDEGLRRRARSRHLGDDPAARGRRVLLLPSRTARGRSCGATGARSRCSASRAWECRPTRSRSASTRARASLGALILGLEPICIALFGALLVRERPSRTDARRARARARGRGRRLGRPHRRRLGHAARRRARARHHHASASRSTPCACRRFAHLVGGIPAAAATMTAGGLAILPFALVELARGTRGAGRRRARARSSARATTCSARPSLGYALFVYAVARLRPVAARGHAVRAAAARGARRLDR